MNTSAHDQARLLAALDLETAGVTTFEMGGHLDNANDAFLAMSGYSRADLDAGGMTLQHLTPPEWIAASERAYAELQATGRTTP